MPTPSIHSYGYDLPLLVATRRFPAADGDRLSLLAGSWGVAFYVLYFAHLHAWIPTWLFALLGVCAYVRAFNALHESFHAQRASSRWRWARHLMVVTSPLMLGYGPLRRNHAGHHSWAQQPARDPDAYLAYGPWWRALFGALTQPEQSCIRYLARRGLDHQLALQILVHTLVFVGVAWIGGSQGLLAWVLVTRIANTASWFIFDWILHQPWAWRLEALELPWPIARLWAALFGEDNLRAVTHHQLHHWYPTIPSRILPALARVAAERSWADAPT
ncbi:MAG: fatty acid desaturase [Myxococcales bacterium]|nr:fatty acid desaturase [Myxococcales bacterium]